MTIAAIVLAAGLGTRFGAAPKCLARFDGRPLVRRAVEAALAGGADPAIVVTGRAGDAVAGALEGLVHTRIHNDAPERGLASSLRLGFAALPEAATGALVLLADMPLVSAETIAALIAAQSAHPDAAAIVPVHAGRRGNPVLLARRLAPEIAALSGDAGAGPLLRAREDVVALPVDDPGILVDVDTPEALAALIEDWRGARGEA